jgi:hypothetical protein
MPAVRVLEAAAVEATEAAAWYEAHRAGLGDEFREELKRTFDRLAEQRAPGATFRQLGPAIPACFYCYLRFIYKKYVNRGKV